MGLNIFKTFSLNFFFFNFFIVQPQDLIPIKLINQIIFENIYVYSQQE